MNYLILYVITCTLRHELSYIIGYYMYIETSSPRRPNDKAILLSKTFAGSSQPRCLVFWYHMYGSQIGSLAVEVSACNIILFIIKICKNNNWLLWYSHNEISTLYFYTVCLQYVE